MSNYKITLSPFKFPPETSPPSDRDSLSLQFYTKSNSLRINLRFRYLRFPIPRSGICNSCIVETKIQTNVQYRIKIYYSITNTVLYNVTDIYMNKLENRIKNSLFWKSDLTRESNSLTLQLCTKFAINISRNNIRK